MAAEELITRHTSLSNNIIAFCRFLRQHRFFVGLSEQTEVLRILTILQPFDQPEAFRLALRAILVKNHAQHKSFDALYNQYWRELDQALDAKIKTVETPKPRPGSHEKAFLALKDWLSGNNSSKKEEAKDSMEIAAFNEAEVLTQTDFSAFSEEQVPELLELLRKLARKLSRDLSRRYTHGKQHQQLDLRHILRKNLRRGGEIVELAYKQPQKNRVRLVLICDVSRSMELYSRFLIHFMFGLQQAFSRMETFVFGTRLTRITAAMQAENFDKALLQLQEQVPDWFGGTRIGASLEQFCREYSHQMLTKKTIVLIMSDGWDTGAIDTLEKSMQTLHKKSAKVVWLNPLAGNLNYQPSVRAMEVALPYVDVHLAAHNIDSLKALLKHL